MPNLPSGDAPVAAGARCDRRRSPAIVAPISLLFTLLFASIASAQKAVIPVTWVRGISNRAVDACVCEGVLDNGDKITINLPREPVVFSRTERQGLKLRVVVVAVPIECPTVLTRSNGERYEGAVTFLACEAHTVGRDIRLADATTTPDAVLTLIPGTK